ncbi:hypothetical protein EL80_5308 [Escherichia coli]|nr:hypothetical protein EL80_5308 [Escherichia coli]
MTASGLKIRGFMMEFAKIAIGITATECCYDILDKT